MRPRLRLLIWLDEIVDKLRWKHGVEPFEVIEALHNDPAFVRKEAGHRPGEDVYAAFARTDAGRPLSVFFVYTEDQRAIIVSARDMTAKEANKYG